LSGPKPRWSHHEVRRARRRTRPPGPSPDSTGNDHDVSHARPLLDALEQGAVVIADKGYDADGVRASIRDHGAIPIFPIDPTGRPSWLEGDYRQRNHVKRFLNKLKRFRRVATRFEKLGANFFALVKFASLRIWLPIASGLRQADRFHHFVAAGVWDAAPLETELLAQADKLVGGGDAVLVIDDMAMPKKGIRSVSLRNVLRRSAVSLFANNLRYYCSARL
jgi:transposase